MSTPTTVIYHSADYDGIFCREIARKFLPNAKLIGWDFADEPLRNVHADVLYILDLPVDRPFGFKFEEVGPLYEDEGFSGYSLKGSTARHLVWIDHHKSSIETHPPSIPGYRIDGVAACRLAWQWFTEHRKRRDLGFEMPTKKEFVDRTVMEPLAVRLAGEYDIWDKRDPDAELFQHGLRSRDLSNDWGFLLEPDRHLSIDEIQALIDVGHDKHLCRPDGTTPNPCVLGLLEAGRGLQYARTQENASIIKAAGFTVDFEGLRFLACNHARYNSFLFTAGLTAEHDACLGFCWKGGKWVVSLYHAPGKEHHDLSLIAVKHGGGGHRGACGFTAAELPFKLDSSSAI